MSEDGRTATAPYPHHLEREAPMAISVEGRRYGLPEWFSPNKIDQIPIVSDYRFSWEEIKAPPWIGTASSEQVQALKFEFQVQGYEGRSAPITVFFGDLAIGHNQLVETGERLSGYVFRPDLIENGVPVTVDFGDGLRVLAMKHLELPPR